MEVVVEVIPMKPAWYMDHCLKQQSSVVGEVQHKFQMVSLVVVVVS